MSDVELSDDLPIELGPIPGLEDSIFGYGMNCITGAASLTTCFNKVTKFDPAPVGTQNVQISVVKDSYSFSSFMSAAASFSASGLTWSASAALSYASTQMSSDTYVSYAAMRLVRSQAIYIDQTTAEVAPEAIAMIKDPARGPAAFLAAYGTHCVVGVTYGGSFIGRLRFETRSTYDKQDITASMSGSISAFGGGGSVNAEFQSEITRIKTHYELNANFSIIGSTTNSFSSNDPDGLIKASQEMKLDHDARRNVDGAAVAFVCKTWDRFPAIAKALAEIGQPRAFDFSGAQANFTMLSNEYSALQFIIGTCQNMLRSRDFAIPSYGVVLQSMLNAAATGQRRIQELTIEQLIHLTPQSMAPYLISSQMTVLLDAICRKQVLVRVHYLADGTFVNGGEYSATRAEQATTDEVLVATFHKSQQDRDGQTLWFYFHIGHDDHGDYLTTHLKWHDPYGPGSGDWYGQRIDLGTAGFPVGVSDAVWAPWPWTHISAQLVGFNQASLYGWSQAL